jgi:hypothetical protein
VLLSLLNYIRNVLVDELMLEVHVEEPGKLATKQCQKLNQVVTSFHILLIRVEIYFPPLLCSLQCYILLFFIYDLIYTLDIFYFNL